ncbi:MAG TPA: site-specific integrase [Tepidisphaeraceae bacterium]|nr:site-specific integrase [Tepidisphaeraceae bacterium]
MARPRTIDPKYRLHKSSGRAYVVLDGRPVYLGRHGTPESRSEYARVKAEWIISGRAPLPDATAADAGKRLSVATVIDAWIDHACAFYGVPASSLSKRPAGEMGNFWTPLSELRRLYGDTPAADFGPKRLKILAYELARDRQVPDPKTGQPIHRRGMVRKVVNRALLRIKQVFKWAVEDELLPGESYARLRVAGGLKRGRCDAREGEPVRPVPDSILDSTLPHLSRHVAAMVKVQLLTGLRPGELVSMTPRQLEMGKELWTYRVAVHKTLHRGYERIVEIGPQAQTILREFLGLGRALDAPIFNPGEAEAERREQLSADRRTPRNRGNVPGSNRVAAPKWKPGTGYTTAAYRRAITRACDAADGWAKGGLIVGDDERPIPRWHPHQLRHNHATTVRAKFGIEAARVALGHRDVDTTELYAERDAALRRRVALEVG